MLQLGIRGQYGLLVVVTLQFYNTVEETQLKKGVQKKTYSDLGGNLKSIW